MAGSTREQLIRLLEPEVEALGFELVELEFSPHRGGGLLRLYIDRAGGAPDALAPPAESEDAFAAQSQGGVHVDDCATVSRRVSEVLDAADPIPGAYTLEVSSPGFDRPLRTRAHWERFRGHRVHAETALPRDGRRRWTGRLDAVRDDGTVVLEVDGETVELGLGEIRHARLVPEFDTGAQRRDGAGARRRDI